MDGLLGRNIFRGYVSLREDRFDFLAGILTSITPSFFKAFPRSHPSKPSIKRRSRPPGSMMGPLRLVINGQLSMILPTPNSGNGSCHEVDHKEKYSKSLLAGSCKLGGPLIRGLPFEALWKEFQDWKSTYYQPTNQPTNHWLIKKAPKKIKIKKESSKSTYIGLITPVTLLFLTIYRGHNPFISTPIPIRGSTGWVRLAAHPKASPPIFDMQTTPATQCFTPQSDRLYLQFAGSNPAGIVPKHCRQWVNQTMSQSNNESMTGWVGGFNQTRKNMIVKFDHFPNLG